MADFSFLPARKRDGTLIARHHTAQVFLGRDIEGKQVRRKVMLCPEGCAEVAHRKAVKFSGSKAAAKQAAQRWADQQRANAGTGTTFAEVAWAIVNDGKLATSTRGGYRSRLRADGRIMPVFSARKVSDISTRDLAEWRDHWDRKVRSGDIKPSTVNQDWAIIRRVMRRAHERGLIMNNPAMGVRRIEQGEASIKAPKWQDVQAAIDHLRSTGLPSDQVIAAMVSVAVLSGMRLGELVVLRWEDVTFTDVPIEERRSIEDWSRIHVRWSYDAKNGRKPPKSRRGVRDVVMTARLEEILRTWRSVQPETPWVFHSTRFTEQHIFHDRAMKRLRAIVDDHAGRTEPCELCGQRALRVRMHLLRHLTGATAGDAGVPATAIAEMLGDDVQTVIKNYLRSDAGSIDAAAAVGRAALGAGI